MILCADWGKESYKRTVYVADVSARIVRRVDGGEWSVGSVLDEARRRASRGPVLATLDAPLAVPESYLAAAARIPSWRAVDAATKAKTLFAKAGIPGSVGSATCALWRELGPRLTVDRSFKLWPFEGDLGDLPQSTPVVVGEIYPRAAYATALSDASAESRAPLMVSKTRADVRRDAITTLLGKDWVRRLDVSIRNLADVRSNEDDFDALSSLPR